MFKKIALAALTAVLLAASAAEAKDPQKKAKTIEYGLFNHLGIGVTAGLMDGIGIDVAAPVIPQLRLRAGFSFLPSIGIGSFPVNIPAWGTHPATQATITPKIGWGIGHFMVDYYPGKKSGFHVTAGLFFAGETLASAQASVTDATYQNAGINYYVDGNINNNDARNIYYINFDQQGLMNVVAKTNAVRPYLGIGFGKTVPDKVVSVTFDFGVEYIGGIKAFANGHTSIDPTDVPVQITSEGVLSVVNQFESTPRTELVDSINGMFPQGAINFAAGFPILPVLRLGLHFRIF